MVIKFRTTSRGALAAAAVWAAAAILIGCKPKPTNVVITPGPGASPNTVVTVPGSTLPTKAAPTPGQEVTEVKAMISDMRNVKNMSELSEFFTNESSAALGLMMMIPVAMIGAFEDMGNQMSTEMNKQLGGSKTQTPPPPAASQGPKIKAELEATLKKYGLSEKTQPNDKQAMAAVTARGREFFRDMAGLLDKVGKKDKGSDAAGMTGIQKDKMPDPDDATYQVLSPTRVKITEKHPKDPTMKEIEARWEDGRWRLHIGSLEELMKKGGMSNMGGAMPGGPAGMSGAPGPGATMGGPPPAPK